MPGRAGRPRTRFELFSRLRTSGESPGAAITLLCYTGTVYFGVFIEGTKAGTYASFKTPAAATFKASSGLKVYPWFTNGPLLKGFKTKPASATTPEKTLKEVVDVVISPVCVVQ